MATLNGSLDSQEKPDKAQQTADIAPLNANDTGAYRAGTKIEQVPPGNAVDLLPKYESLTIFKTPESTAGTKWPVDQAKMEEAAKQLNDAFNSSWYYAPSRLFDSKKTGWGYDFNQAYKILENKTPEEIKAIDGIYARTYGPDLASNGERFGIKEQMQRSATESEVARYDMLMNDKRNNDVPEQFRISGDQLLKPGSKIKVGEVTDIKMGDRHFEVYVPKNADSRAPVIIAMHGAAGGDGPGLPREEMGMVAAAERTGSIVLFGYPKVRSFDAGTVFNTIGANTGAAWNVPGRINLPAEEDRSYSDIDYLDNIVKNVQTQVQTADRVGLAGFSDGGRLAQIYASERPDKVTGVYSSHSTWMEGEALPLVPVPIKVVLSKDDRTLPIDGGMGSVSNFMNKVVATNLALSRPRDIEKVWANTNECDDKPRVVIKPAVTVTDYSCKGAPVVVNVYNTGQHAWDDHGNRGNPLIQSVLHGSADRTRTLSLDAQRWLKQQGESRGGLPVKIEKRLSR